MSNANDRQVGGNHYKGSKTGREHWDVVDEFDLDYFQGQITKYVMRWKRKGGVADLEKARHFLDKYIELETAKARAAEAVKAGTIVLPWGGRADGSERGAGPLWDADNVQPADRSGS